MSRYLLRLISVDDENYETLSGTGTRFPISTSRMTFAPSPTPDHFDSRYLIGVVVPMSKNVLLLRLMVSGGPAEGAFLRPFYSDDRMNFHSSVLQKMFAFAVLCPEDSVSYIGILLQAVEQEKKLYSPRHLQQWA